MSGFEVIVRPVVFPNIRPAPSRSLPPEDDPESGKFTFSGSNGQVISLNHSFSANGQSVGGTETERTYDTVRVRGSSGGGGGAFSALAAALAETGDDGAYIDVEVMKRVRMQGGDGVVSTYNYASVQEADNVTIINRDQTRTS